MKASSVSTRRLVNANPAFLSSNALSLASLGESSSIRIRRSLPGGPFSVSGSGFIGTRHKTGNTPDFGQPSYLLRLELGEELTLPNRHLKKRKGFVQRCPLVTWVVATQCPLRLIER